MIWFPQGQSPTGGLGGGTEVVVSVTVTVVVVVVAVVVIFIGGIIIGGNFGGSEIFFCVSKATPSPAPQHQVPFLMVMVVQ